VLLVKKRSGSSQRWLREHFSDIYVQQAQQQGLRSRAYFKLSELDKKERLFRPGMCIVDLGAAPGGWSQYLCQKLGSQAKLFALDILPMEALPGVAFICGDFTQEDVYHHLIAQLGSQKVDMVLSDMAPNWSGCRQVDIPKAMYLAELAADFAKKMLTPGGGFLVKLFQGEGFDAYLKDMRILFHKVLILKPQASRDRSPEVYLLAKGFKS
jgi:23S rRNA (uridine2552-2'-O)-methyltransferase